MPGVLARRPEVCLVDELAHTNAPGLERSKRYEDVEDMLAAGIDVLSTMNVQHIESLNDKVAEDRKHPEIFDAFRKANARKFRGFLAPEYNIRCIEAAVNLPFEEGLRVERELFREVVTGSPVARSTPKAAQCPSPLSSSLATAPSTTRMNGPNRPAAAANHGRMNSSPVS